MRRNFLFVLVAALLPAYAWAVDGQVLINQATVMAAGGFPYKITQPGSYKLTGNLTVPGNADGIQIMAGSVTLDLNGFSITGPVTCSGGQTGSAITCTGTAEVGITNYAGPAANITLKNGTVQGFWIGISLAGGTVVEIQATGNQVNGMTVNNAILVRCNASLNGGSGVAASYSTVSDSNAYGNNGDGFSLLFSVLNHSAATSNHDCSVVAGRTGLLGNVILDNAYGICFGIQGVSLFGSNTISGAHADLAGSTSYALSQNNNSCSNGPC